MLKIYSHHPTRLESQLDEITHKELVKNLLSGLDKLGESYIYQPQTYHFCKDDNILILSDHLAMRDILKENKNKNFNLIVGPHIEPEDTHISGKQILLEKDKIINPLLKCKNLNSFLKNENISGVLTSSSWAKDAWNYIIPEISEKLYTWTSGVNPEYWDGKSNPINKTAVIYIKTNPGIAENAKKTLSELGIKAKIIKYGKYAKNEYRDLLRKADFAVFISERETQGLALAEAWAMNVPTFCWDPFHSRINGFTHQPTSSCPYLTRKTGARWGNIEELRSILYTYKREYFSPREWVMENMTDKISAAKLVKVIEEARRKKLL